MSRIEQRMLRALFEKFVPAAMEAFEEALDFADDPEPMPEGDRPLSGIKALDLTRIKPGGFEPALKSIDAQGHVTALGKAIFPTA